MQIGDGSTLRQFRKITVKRAITYALIFLLYLVVISAVVEVAWKLYLDLSVPPYFIIEIDEILDLLGMFLLILVAIELLDTIKAYLDENVVHVEVVLEAAMIAVARKIIILNTKEISSLTIIGIGVLLVALSAGYYVVKSQHSALGHSGQAKQE